MKSCESFRPEWTKSTANAEVRWIRPVDYGHFDWTAAVRAGLQIVGGELGHGSTLNRARTAPSPRHSRPPRDFRSSLGAENRGTRRASTLTER